MNGMQKEWKKYTKKIILNGLYEEKQDKRVTYFLENYSLLKVSVLNNNQYEFKREILFSKDNEILKIISIFKPGAQRFFWIISDKFNSQEIQVILDKFDFDRYIE